MIERHVTFQVLPEHTADFEHFFVEKYRPAMSVMCGFRNVELLREQGQPDHYQMVIRFDTVEDAAVWRASEAHKGLQPGMKTLYAASELTVYDVIA